MRLPPDAHAKARFPLGLVVATPNALTVLSSEEIQSALGRHDTGDWGDVESEDWQANERALREGGRLFSVYHSRNAVKFWIITEHDRSLTTILLPEDY